MYERILKPGQAGQPLNREQFSHVKKSPGIKHVAAAAR
jgi:hypothetical protein